MYNQVQGTYPQLAGSFQNAQGMMPHDNGRTAQQVPTFFGGLQNMMSASQAMSNYQNIPLGQNILRTQAMAGQQYANTMGAVVGGIGTGTSLLTAGAGLATLGGFSGSGIIGSTIGMLGGGMGLAGSVAIGATVHSYKKKMREIEEMRQLTQQGNFGHGLTDSFTGQMTRSSALGLSNSLGTAAKFNDFKSSEFKQLTGMASSSGMLTGTNNIGEITKKITDLAKASREIVMLGEGISMNDAVNLQKLTQDMGIGTGKFRAMGIGKNLVSAARAANMSMDQAAQMGGQGAITFQQMGLGAASGMNAAFQMNNAAQALVGSGSINKRLLRQLGGAQGVSQNLLAGQASTMGRLADTLVMGAAKMDPDGNFRVDRELLDQFTRGDVSREDMVRRGKNLGKGLSKFERSRMLEQLGRQMPELREQVTDSLSNEEMMQIQGREVMSLQKRTGMSMRQAANSYFQDSGQAESFMAYAQNFGTVRAESRRQRKLSETEEMYRYAGMAKSNTALSRAGRYVTEKGGEVIDRLLSMPTALGEYAARQVAEEQDRIANRIARGSSRLFSHLDTQAGSRIEFSGKELVEGAKGVPGVRKQESQDALLSRIGSKEYMKRMGIDGIFDFGGGGLADKIEVARTGEMNPLTRLLSGHYSGLEHSYGNYDNRLEDVLRSQAQMTDEANLIGELRGSSRQFDYANKDSKLAYRKTIAELHKLGKQRAEGRVVDVMEITPNMLAAKLNLDLSSPEVKSAVGKAFNSVLNSGGKARQGLSELFKSLEGPTGYEDSFGASAFKEDELTLGRGAILQAEGLDKALHESGIGGDDLQKLLRAMNEHGDTLFQENTPYNIAEVFRAAGLKDYSRFNMGGVKNLIDTIRSGSVTRSTGDTKQTFGIDQYIEGLDLTSVNKNSINSRVSKVRDVELEKFNALIGRNLGNAAGGDLLQDLAKGVVGVDTNNIEGYRDKVYKGILEDQAKSDQGEVTRLAKQQLIQEDLEFENNLQKGGATGVSNFASNLMQRQERHNTRGKRLEEIRVRIDQERRQYRKENTRDVNKDYIEKKAKELQAKDKADYEKSLFGEDATSLKDVLTNLSKGAGTDKQQAYQNLMNKDYFNRLETEYQKTKYKAGGATKEDKQNMIKKIMDQVARAGAENKLQKGEAKGLQDIMGEISGALVNQNKILNKIALAPGGKIELLLTASAGSSSSKTAEGEGGTP